MARGESELDAGDGEPHVDHGDAGTPPADAADHDADLVFDPEWAMWRLPPAVPGAADYSALGDVVRDETTQLEWLVDPLEPRSRAEAASACAALQGAGGGFRLPTRIELLSLVDYDPEGDGINPFVFGASAGTEEAWTSSSAALSPAKAWFVGFATGESAMADASMPKVARCVRGSASKPRSHYALDGDIARDLWTGLEWRRERESHEPLSLADALLACDAAAGGGWRVPSARELESLVDVRAATAPTWNRDAFGSAASDAPPVFWTLTKTRESGASAAYRVVDFRPTREGTTLGKAEFAYVRCVSGPR